MTNLLPDGSLADPFSNYIALSRYARWVEDENRREVWSETVDRYLSYMTDTLTNNFSYAPDPLLVEEIRGAIHELELVPSMRALMTAGPALERSGIAAYNCSYLTLDDPQAFSELLYILMNGTGVGYSVEKTYVSQLPPVPQLNPSEIKRVVVEDSKEGWAEAFSELLGHLWNGYGVTWDLSQVRPEGERLRTFGGRASGPQPLDDLFHFTSKIFANSRGRKLKPIEAHDIACMVAKCIVSGGVRRSAMISLSDLDDQEMANAKSGEWWKENDHRALANNSAVYYDGMGYEAFIKEWDSLVESGSGERGIFNRDAARRQAARFGRDPHADYGTNPCLTFDSKVLTSQGVRNIGDLAEDGGTFEILNGDGKWAESFAWETGVKPVYKVTMSNGLEFSATSDHKIEVMGKKYKSSDTYTIPTEVEVGDLRPGMKVRPFTNPYNGWTGGEEINDDFAIALGILYGDGYFHRNVESHALIATREQEVIDHLSKVFGSRFSLQNEERSVYKIHSLMDELVLMGLDLLPLPERGFPEVVWSWSSRAAEMFLRGLYSANGSALPRHNRISLKTTSMSLAQGVLNLLSSLGLNGYITTNQPTEIEWENGTYTSRESYDVNINGPVQYREFQRRIGFIHDHKSIDCHGTTTTYAPRCVEVTSVEYEDVVTVYDFHEANTHWGWINGLKIHNCSEIILRPNQFCNLSEVIVRGEDSLEDLQRKVRLASILGTWQSTISHFPYLRDIWRKNTEEERLLGVSLTGVFGNPLINHKRDGLSETLSALRNSARASNKNEADMVGINASMSVTCVKPSGTVSQLAKVSSGLHPWHSEQYIRTIRESKTNPLSRLMKDCGVPVEEDAMNSTNNVFSFPVQAPKGSVTREDLSAIDHLDIWLEFQRHWCEHKPSVTISVKENEWEEVGKWVWDHIDEISGVSFLPFSEHTYDQAPYQEISVEEYVEAKSSFPDVYWGDLSFYEVEDSTTGSQEYACSANGCDIK